MGDEKAILFNSFLVCLPSQSKIFDVSFCYFSSRAVNKRLYHLSVVDLYVFIIIAKEKQP